MITRMWIMTLMLLLALSPFHPVSMARRVEKRSFMLASALITSSAISKKVLLSEASVFGTVTSRTFLSTRTTAHSHNNNSNNNVRSNKRTTDGLFLFNSLTLRGGSNNPSKSFSHQQEQSHSTAASSLNASPSMDETDNERDAILNIAIESLCQKQQPNYNFGGLLYTNTELDTRYRVLFVLGGPGAGKGTQSELMLQNYPTAHFSVGQLLRDEQESDNNSPHQQIIKETLLSGKIVPVEISLQLLSNAMNNIREKSVIVLVDGFPRNYDNLQGWCSSPIMKDTTILKGVLVYQCPLDILEERIMKRSIEAPGRTDDNREAVHKRFKTFEQQTVPVIDVLRDVSTTNGAPFHVIDIQGNQPIDDVWMSTQQVLNQFIVDDVLTANAALIRAIETSDATKYQQLCDPLWFRENDAVSVMNQQEGGSTSTIHEPIQVENAHVDVISGKHVAVSYNRMIDGIPIKEKRIWSHHGAAGWQLVHFIRTPPSQQQQHQQPQQQPESTSAPV